MSTINRHQSRINIIIELYQYDLLKEDFVLSMNEEFIDISDIFNKLSTIDSIISNNLFSYSLNRLSFLDRAIIRLATYELLYTETSKTIIINEAIEITKKYCNLDDEKQHKFTNALLDSISKMKISHD